MCYAARMIDTHCHLTYEGLHEQADAVVARALAARVDRMITIGTTPEDARAALQLADRHASVFVAGGMHPNYATVSTEKASLLDALRAMMTHPKFVALGEMGLDQHHREPALDIQQRVLDWQLEFAAPLDLPIVIHNRLATQHTLDMLKASGIAPSRFVFHCFTGTDAEADSILEFGAMISFTGIVTFKNGTALAAASDRVPMDRLMIETDSPFLTPEPHRKVRPNEPAYVPYVAKYLAARRNMPEAEFVGIVDTNAQRFFAKMK